LKQLTFADLPVNKDIQYEEMLRYLINEGKIAKDKHEYYWTDIKCPLGERPAKVLRKCPDCNQRHEDVVEWCNTVWGRRGWRQLGEYDT